MGSLDFFDHDDFEEQSLIPAGTYDAVITACDVKETKSGTGKYIELTIQITSGQLKGRFHWERLNVENPNPTAQNMGRAKFKELKKALKKPDIRNNEDLYNTPFKMKLKIQKAKEGSDFGDSNEVDKFLPSSEAASLPPAPKREDSQQPVDVLEWAKQAENIPF